MFRWVESALPFPQGDLWATYLEASLYGQEVFTCGGARGPAHAYFVPLLSGYQLFTSAPPADANASDDVYNGGDTAGSGGKGAPQQRPLYACDGGEELHHWWTTCPASKALLKCICCRVLCIDQQGCQLRRLERNAAQHSVRAIQSCDQLMHVWPPVHA